jgi:hypothetical protein
MSGTFASLSAERGRASERAVLDALRQYGTLATAELALQTNLAPRSVRRVCDRLSGYVVQEAGCWALTVEGTVTGLEVVRVMDLSDALALLPCEEHRAFVRLAVSAAIAKMALASTYASGWPGFVAWSKSTRTMKTSIGYLIGCLLAQREPETILLTSDRGAGDLLGRRRQLPGGAWTFDPAPALKRRFLVLDELDKAADESTRKAARRMLHGDAQLDMEGIRVTLGPVVMATCNATKLEEVLGESYHRRCIVMASEGLCDVEEATRAGQAIHEPGAIAPLDLSRLTPTIDRLSSAQSKLLSIDLPGRFLTARGAELHPDTGLALAAIGRTGFGLGGDGAAIQTGLDYLLVASTWGATTAEAIGEYCRAVGIVQPPTTIGRTGSMVTTVAEDLDFAGDKAEALYEIGAARRRLGPRLDWNREAVGLAARLDEAARRVEETTSPTEARDILEGLRPTLEMLQAWTSKKAARQYAARPTSRAAAALGAAPDHLTVLQTLLAVGSSDPPQKVLVGLGLIRLKTVTTMAGTKHRVYEATDPSVGVAITEDEGWGGTGQVHGVLVKAIEALERKRAVSQL